MTLNSAEMYSNSPLRYVGNECLSVKANGIRIALKILEGFWEAAVCQYPQGELTEKIVLHHCHLIMSD